MQHCANNIKKDFVTMVFGESESDVEGLLSLFTNPKLREKNEKGGRVHKNGVSRCPQLNHFTGSIAMYMNPDILNIIGNETIFSKFAEVYGVEIGKLGLCHGPPTILIKPNGAGVSPPFVFSFQDLSTSLKYTGLMSLTSHERDYQAAGLQELENFDAYFEILSSFFNFEKHCQEKDILHLEKWFSVDVANRAIEDYTNYYNLKVRGLAPKLDREIPIEIIKIFESQKFEVPIVPKLLTWKNIPMPMGELKLFSSRQAIRTLAGNTSIARVYVQIPIEPKPEWWEGSSFQKDLDNSYSSGRFGDWSKPGKRKYMRENKTEWDAMTEVKLNEAIKIVQKNKSFFAL